MRHIVTSETAEWFTPGIYIEAARTVMGGIDLDPASCELANRTVRATKFFTAEYNGLTQEWHGQLFLNLPYRRDGIQGKFVDKLVREYRSGRWFQAIILIGNRTECAWFAPLWAYPLCFTNHRIAFISPAGKKDSPVNANVFVYLGSNPGKFREVFSQFGEIVVRMQPGI
jgi:ParB family chromosome partitioning protein